MKVSNDCLSFDSIKPDHDVYINACMHKVERRELSLVLELYNFKAINPVKQLVLYHVALFVVCINSVKILWGS